MTDVYGGTVNKFMCTPACPCDDKHKATWSALTAAQTKDAGKNRVQTYADLTAAEKTALNGSDENNLDWQYSAATVVPLYWATANNNVDKAGGVFTNFLACFNANLKT